MPDLPAPSDSKATIPEALQLQLDGFRRHLWRVKVIEAAAAGIIGLLVSFLLVYGLDRIWQTPSGLRLGILLAGVSLFAIFAPYWLHRWVWRQRRETQLARLIAQRYPGLGDRLLGVIELQTQQGNADTFSPRLRDAAIEAVALETARYTLTEALPPQRHRSWAAAAIVLTGISAIAFMLAPQAGWNAFQRWLMPLSKTERYTFTRLENPPTYLSVPLGEAFDVTLYLAKNSDQRPMKSTGRFGLQPVVEASLASDRYQFTFPGQQDPGTIVFHSGDLRHELRVTPVQRPSVEMVAAVITSPAYLNIPEKTISLNLGTFTAVEGSKVGIQLTMNRPLVSATFGPTRSLDTNETPAAGPTIEPISGKLEISDRTTKTPLLDVGVASFEIPFAWTDEFGLTGDDKFRVKVEATRDAAPTIYLQGIDHQKAILPEETVDFELLAEDDFGIKNIGIEWNGQFTRPTDEAPAKGEITLVEGQPQEQRIIKPASISPKALNISPQKIMLRAYSEDYFPNRGRTYSEPVILYVLTRDEHAQMLKNKFDRTIGELEDLTRREIELLEENQRLARLKDEELKEDETINRIEVQEQAEAQSKRRMEDLTESMESLMKDAARNGDIRKNTLKKMAESLKSMQELSQQDIPKIQEKLGAAQQPTNSADKSEKDISDAVEEQEKAVKKMQDAIDKANDANRQFEAGTFVNRLKKAASEQEGIATTLVDAYQRLLGFRYSKLDPPDQRRLSEVKNQQANTASDVRWLQEDLSNYFARTKTESFGKISEEIKASQIDNALEEIRNLLAKNHSFIATENSKKWADKLTEWAKKLEGENDESKGGGSGDNGKRPEDEDFEFMLRVMNLIQQEQDIRSQTRVLEQFRRNEGSLNPRNP